MLVSAVISGGPPRRLLEVIADGAAELVLPEPVVEELERVLRVKIGLGTEQVAEIAKMLDELAEAIVAAPDQVPERSGDRDDDRILAAAAGAGADVLVSGDARHLLPVGQHQGMRVVRPQDLLAKLAG